MRARELLAVTLVALAPACATQDASEQRAAPRTALDAPAPRRVEQPELELLVAEEELGLAEYERLLADNENRLRAAGVLLAARGQHAEEAPVAGGYAPPPPAPVTSAPADGDTAAVATKSKRASKTGAGRGAGGGVVAPAPRPASKSESARPDKREQKNVKYDAAATPAPEYSAEPPANRCQTICDLSATTCELEGKICDLAGRHPDDPRYAELCRRADDDCRLAAEACQRCSP